MRFLVFGSRGFIGKNLVKRIQAEGHFVTSLDIEDIDVRFSLDWIDTTFNLKDYDYIYYLTAISDISACNSDVINAFSTNVSGLIYLLEQLKENKPVGSYYLPLFIFSSSVYVYNNDSGIYGITKRTAEAIIKWYGKNRGLDYRILRYGSVYGSGSNKNNAIYRMIKEAIETGIISYYGTGEEVREYIHVKDVVKNSLEILDSKYKNKTLTISGHFPMKAKDMCYMLKEILGSEYAINFKCETPSGHYITTPYSYMPDISEKYISKTYYDLGSGLLDLIKEIKGEG